MYSLSLSLFVCVCVCVCVHTYIAQDLPLFCGNRGLVGEGPRVEDEALRVLESARVLILSGETAFTGHKLARGAAATSAGGRDGRGTVKGAFI
jgi:hypothetical protein